jgi:putative ABC transport system permease protein
MNLLKLTIRNIAGSSFRSWIIFFCAALMAGFAVSATLIIGGAEDSLELARERLGADIIVVPRGAETRVQDAILMGNPVHCWMPASNITEIAAIPGVRTVSPQLYLATLVGASCCAVPEMFLIAYDPATDFTLRPWLEENLNGELARGQAIGGAFVFIPPGQDSILVYGYEVDLRGTLEPTGTGLDRSMFFTFETAREIARLSYTQAVKPLEIPPDSISAVLVRVDSDADPHAIAQEIARRLPDTTPLESTNLFQTQRTQIRSLLRSVAALMGIVWVLSVALVAALFSIAVNERRRQIGVMRALGATRFTVLRAILAEGILLALGGGIIGVAVASLAVYLFRPLIMRLMAAPFLFPALPELLALALQALGATLVSIILTALLPALRISLTDPAIAMRE